MLDKIKANIDTKVVVSTMLGVIAASLLATLMIKSAVKPLAEVGKAIKN